MQLFWPWKISFRILWLWWWRSGSNRSHQRGALEKLEISLLSRGWHGNRQDTLKPVVCHGARLSYVSCTTYSLTGMLGQIGNVATSAIMFQSAFVTSCYDLLCLTAVDLGFWSFSRYQALWLRTKQDESAAVICFAMSRCIYMQWK